MGDLKTDIEIALQRHAGERPDHTSHSLVAEYLIVCLAAFDAAMAGRAPDPQCRCVPLHTSTCPAGRARAIPRYVDPGEDVT